MLGNLYSYTANFKLQVIAFAKSLNNSMTSRPFLLTKTNFKSGGKCACMLKYMHSMIISHVCSLQDMCACI